MRYYISAVKGDEANVIRQIIENENCVVITEIDVVDCVMIYVQSSLWARIKLSRLVRMIKRYFDEMEDDDEE